MSLRPYTTGQASIHVACMLWVLAANGQLTCARVKHLCRLLAASTCFTSLRLSPSVQLALVYGAVGVRDPPVSHTGAEYLLNTMRPLLVEGTAAANQLREALRREQRLRDLWSNKHARGRAAILALAAGKQVPKRDEEGEDSEVGVSRVVTG